MEHAELTRNQSAQLLWEEWKYRHELFWRSLFRWGTAATLITVAPWVQTDLVDKLGLMVLFFPFLASLIAVFASWHVAAEYSRLRKVDRRYRDLLGRFAPDPIVEKPFPVGWLWKLPIGWVVPICFLIFAIPVSILNAVLLAIRVCIAK